MKIKRILGWVLICLGLAIIFWSLYSSYNIFTAKAEVPEVFKIEQEPQLSSEKKNREDLSPSEIQEEMEKMIEQQIKEIIPSEVLSKLLNLIAWMMLAGILVFGGGKISGIGIRLIKEP